MLGVVRTAANLSGEAGLVEFGARLRYRTECTSLEQDADGVTAILSDLESGAETSVRAKYVVAAGTYQRGRPGEQAAPGGRGREPRLACGRVTRAAQRSSDRTLASGSRTAGVCGGVR